MAVSQQAQHHFPTHILQQTDHELSRALKTSKAIKEDMKGNQGGHVGTSNALYDALYEKAFVSPKLILLKLITSFCFYTAVGL